MESIDEIMESSEWNAVLADAGRMHHSVPASWRRHIARHVKLLSFVGDSQEGYNEGTSCTRENEPQSPIDQHGTANERGSTRTGLLFHPIHCAASQGLVDEGRSMWQAMTDAAEGTNIVDMPDARGRSPLHWAAMTDQHEFVHAVLAAGADADRRDQAGRTPLVTAAAFGSQRVVRALLMRGADKESADHRGLTPLHAAAAGGHLTTVAELLASGANPARRAHVGATPRHIAQRQGHRAVANLLDMATGAVQSDHQARMARQQFNWQATMVQSE